MGCRESKNVETVDGGDIHAVLHSTDKSQNFKKSSTNLADTIKQNRGKTTTKRRKSKYDPRITARYDIKAAIGSGRFTKVMRVENKFSKLPYALKVLNKPEGLQSMKCEIAVLTRVKHKNIIESDDVFMKDGKQNLTMGVILELVTGGSLFDRIHEKGIYQERDAAKVSMSVL